MTQCIGSRCMQWRWHDSEFSQFVPNIEVAKELSHEAAMAAISKDELFLRFIDLGWTPAETLCPPAFSSNGTWAITLTKARGDDRRGYCGLAGKP